MKLKKKKGEPFNSKKRKQPRAKCHNGEGKVQKSERKQDLQWVEHFKLRKRQSEQMKRCVEINPRSGME